MSKIDSHQHFWHFDPVRDAWIDDTMQVIRKDFLAEDLQPLLSANNIDGCVAVQADQSEEETNFLLKLATENSIIKGVVGWVDLVADDLSEKLSGFTVSPYFKGVRHIAQGEADDFLLRKDVQRGIGQLSQYELTYDILIFAHQLPAAIELVRSFPDQSFVLDHIAKPSISDGVNEDWRSNLKALAAFPNVSCKLSGMVTETADFQWSKGDFEPFMDIVISAFGTDRVLYGSDWPVCLLAASYHEQLAITEDHIASYSDSEQEQIMGKNAIEFYNLDMEET